MGCWNRNFCYYLQIDLGIGALIVAYLNLVESIVLTLIATEVLNIYFVSPSEDDEYEERPIPVTQWIAYDTAVTNSVLFMIVSVLLIIGLKEHQRRLIFVFLIYVFVKQWFTLLDLSLEVYHTHLYITEPCEDDDPDCTKFDSSPGKILVYVFDIFFSIYTLLVIRSFYSRIRDINAKPDLYVDVDYSSPSGASRSPGNTPTHVVPSPGSRIQHFDFNPAPSETQVTSVPAED